MSISIFNNSRVLSATEIVKETLSFIIDEKGNLAVSFATNKGKGTGAQVVPVEQFSEYIDALTELQHSECMLSTLRNHFSVFLWVSLVYISSHRMVSWEYFF